MLTSDSEEKLNFLNWHIEVFGYYHVDRAFGVEGEVNVKTSVSQSFNIKISVYKI